MRSFEDDREKSAQCQRDPGFQRILKKLGVPVCRFETDKERDMKGIDAVWWRRAPGAWENVEIKFRFGPKADGRKDMGIEISANMEISYPGCHVDSRKESDVILTVWWDTDYALLHPYPALREWARTDMLELPRTDEFFASRSKGICHPGNAWIESSGTHRSAFAHPLTKHVNAAMPWWHEVEGFREAP